MDLKVPVLVSKNTGHVLQNRYEYLLLLLSIHPNCMVSRDLMVGSLATGTVVHGMHGFEGPGSGIKKYRHRNRYFFIREIITSVPTAGTCLGRLLRSARVHGR